MYPYFDPSFIILIPALILSMYAQWKVSSTFRRYQAVRASKGISAAEAARALLDRSSARGVPVEHVAGELSDHYDPTTKTLRLSDSVYSSSSIAALGVAAHEVGHAIQDSDGYGMLKFRNSFVPVANLVSTASMPLFFIGLLASLEPLIYLGIILFCGVVLFHIITLPVELNASSRALAMLGSTGMLSRDELEGAKGVLSAAALTYIAATAMAILQLVRLLVIARGRRREN